MSRGAAELLEGVPGFGLCFARRCRYADVGSPAICSACATARLTRMAPADQRCGICDHPFRRDGTCGNPICGPYGNRWFARNYSIAPKRGVLEQCILNYKFYGQRQWAAIFARVLLGFLEDGAAAFRQYDLIIGSPAYPGDDGRAFDHVRAILLSAEAQAPGAWPFDLATPPAIVKTANTERMTNLQYGQRRDNSPDLRRALSVPDPARTAGKRIIVFDDVFTTGWTLKTVAEVLRRQGRATDVVGVTLARQIKAEPSPEASGAAQPNDYDDLPF